MVVTQEISGDESEAWIWDHKGAIWMVICLGKNKSGEILSESRSLET